jgi:hypothetical protein
MKIKMEFENLDEEIFIYRFNKNENFNWIVYQEFWRDLAKDFGIKNFD